METDIHIVGVRLYLLPVETRVPLKFGSETLTHVTCARVHLRVQDQAGRTGEGWGETPLSVQWVWPSELAYTEREERLILFCKGMVRYWAGFEHVGHALEIGHEFVKAVLPTLLDWVNEGQAEPMPWLAALVCCSAFDIALHDAYGNLHGVPTYETYSAAYLNHDLRRYLGVGAGTDVTFAGRYPADYLVKPPAQLPVWHLVGGLDPLDATELTGSEPDDGYPVTLVDWIARDGLKCLKVKLRGNDSEWDYCRLVRVRLVWRAVSTG